MATKAQIQIRPINKELAQVFEAIDGLAVA